MLLPVQQIIKYRLDFHFRRLSFLLSTPYEKKDKTKIFFISLEGRLFFICFGYDLTQLLFIRVSLESVKTCKVAVTEKLVLYC